MDLGLHKSIARRGFHRDAMATRVIRNPALLAELFAGLGADKADVKYGCEKVLRRISEKTPALLYPYFDVFVQMLDAKSHFLKWGAMATVANLASVDSANKFEPLFEKYFSTIPGPVMISAANTIRQAPKIAQTKPHLAGRIVREILKVEHAKYKTAECANVARGHAIDVLSQMRLPVELRREVKAFVTKNLKNPRAAVRKRAEKFLRKFAMESQDAC